jgi:drug/metabolite transporter (DMT)-like permease
MATAIEMMAGGVLLLIVGLLLGEHHALALENISARSWWALIYLAVFGSLAGFTSYVWLLKNAPLSVASTYAYVNPLVAVLLGVLIAKESLAGNIVSGGIIILISVALITQSNVRKRAP